MKLYIDITEKKFSDNFIDTIKFFFQNVLFL